MEFDFIYVEDSHPLQTRTPGAARATAAPGTARHPAPGGPVGMWLPFLTRMPHGSTGGGCGNTSQVLLGTSQRTGITSRRRVLPTASHISLLLVMSLLRSASHPRPPRSESLAGDLSQQCTSLAAPPFFRKTRGFICVKFFGFFSVYEKHEQGMTNWTAALGEQFRFQVLFHRTFWMMECCPV